MTDLWGIEGLSKHVGATNSRCLTPALTDFQCTTRQLQTGLGHQAPMWAKSMFSRLRSKQIRLPTWIAAEHSSKSIPAAIATSPVQH
jgi:hypothetical protein